MRQIRGIVWILQRALAGGKFEIQDIFDIYYLPDF